MWPKTQVEPEPRKRPSSGSTHGPFLLFFGGSANVVRARRRRTPKTRRCPFTTQKRARARVPARRDRHGDTHTHTRKPAGRYSIEDRKRIHGDNTGQNNGLSKFSPWPMVLALPPIAAMPMMPVTIMMPAMVVVVVMVVVIARTVVVMMPSMIIVWAIIIAIPPSLFNMSGLSLHDAGIKPWRSSCFRHGWR